MDMRRVERFEKARPACARLEFRRGSKQRESAQTAGVNALFFVIQKAAAEGRFGAVIQKDPAFFLGKPSGQAIAFRRAEGIQVVARPGLVCGGWLHEAIVSSAPAAYLLDRPLASSKPRCKIHFDG